MSSKQQGSESSKRRSALANVEPAQLAAMVAMQADDSETLAAMVAMVASMSANDDPDVGAYAVVIAPALWQARRNDAPLVAVVSGALRMARKAVALAHGDELEAWDMYGDMSDLAVEESARGAFNDDARTTLAHYGTAPADSQFGVTYGDVAVTAMGMAGVPTLARVAREYVAHERSECCSGAGRRVTLAGVTAHGEGWGAEDSRYHSSRRAVLAMVKGIDRGAVLAVTGAPGARPSYGRNSVSVGNGYAPHDAPTLIPPTAPRVFPAVETTRVQARTVDYVWAGGPMAGAGDVDVWDNGAACIVRVSPTAVSWAVPVDALGYPVWLGYGASVAPRAAWRAVREESTRVVSLPAREVPGRPVMFGPDVILSCDAAGAVTARAMTEREAGAAGAPYAPSEEEGAVTVLGTATGRAPIVESGDAPSARPDDAPMRGDVTVSGVLRSYKPVVSPRKRSGGNTGPTVPARVPR